MSNLKGLLKNLKNGGMLNYESEDIILLGKFEGMASEIIKNQVKNSVRVAKGRYYSVEIIRCYWTLIIRINPIIRGVHN